MKYRRLVVYGLTVLAALVVCVVLDRYSRGSLPCGGLGWVAAQTLSSCLLIIGVGLLFGRLAPLFHCIVLWVICLVVGASSFIRMYYPNDMEMIGREWILILMSSSFSESCEYVAATFRPMTWVTIALVVLLNVSFGWVLVRFRPRTTCRNTLIAALLLCVPFAILNRPPHPYCDCLAMSVFDQPFWIHREMLDVWQDLARTGMKTDCQFCCASDRLVGVFVLGESSTRHHWSLYGYGRKTTPRMDALRDELIVFTNVTTECWMSTPALRSHMTDFVTGSHPATISLPSAVVAAGFDSVLLSGQSPWGYVDGTDNMLYASCSERTFLSTVSSGRYYDDSLVPLLSQALSKSFMKKAVFVHLLGSHREYVQRYPTERTVFGGVDGVSEVDAYDNSIAFSDSVVADMIEQLRKIDGPAFLVYVSDHGEEPTAVDRRRGESMRSIPLVVWLSPEYRTRFPSFVSNLSALAVESHDSDALFPIYLNLFQLSEQPPVSFGQAK